MDGAPDIKSKKDAIAIIQVLLPRLNDGPRKGTLSSFKALKDCVQWLGDIRRGRTTWYDELETSFSEVDDEAYLAPEGDDEVEGVPRDHVDEDGVEGTAD